MTRKTWRFLALAGLMLALVLPELAWAQGVPMITTSQGPRGTQYSVTLQLLALMTAQGEVTVRLAKGGRIVNGQGADTDIVIASAKAYINGLNKLHSKLERAHPQV